MRRLAIVAAGLALSLLQGVASASYGGSAAVATYVDELVAEHGFERAALLAVFADAKRQQGIIDAISRPAEKTWAWYEYRALFLQPERIAEGVAFWRENEAALAAAHERFGVSPEYVVAIIGVETRYGRHLGRHRVIDALATLAFDYPPRASFFRRELTQYLLLAREEGKNPLDLVGSYAGAMGYGQFISSSYRRYAVDFDDDGVRDIWQNRKDAIGSVANYFAEHGWRGDGPLAVEVASVPPAAAALANKSLKLSRSVGELRALGVTLPGEIDADTPAALFRFEHLDGPRFLIGLNDFYVITRYNHSRLYARAVHELSQAILAQRRLAVPAE